MISTVTTSTVTTVTSVLDLLGAVSLIAVLTFAVMLVAREVLDSTNNHRALQLKRSMGIGIVPLGIAFLFIFAVRVQGI
ncbi:MAG: hypothetical protein JW384_03464 [Nitrosomonadaceae bacterium]|nr:hypothetical protein [Nitrosomonadaceae bacterium]